MQRGAGGGSGATAGRDRAGRHTLQVSALAPPCPSASPQAVGPDRSQEPGWQRGLVLWGGQVGSVQSLVSSVFTSLYLLQQNTRSFLGPGHLLRPVSLTPTTCSGVFYGRHTQLQSEAGRRGS